jgi:tetratricopeptide (TPR) repeat protein
MNSIAARRYSEAIQRCSQGLEFDPNYPLLRYWLGMAYEQESRYEEAIGELEKAVQLFDGVSFAVGALAHAVRGATRPPCVVGVSR